MLKKIITSISLFSVLIIISGCAGGDTSWIGSFSPDSDPRYDGSQIKKKHGLKTLNDCRNWAEDMRRIYGQGEHECITQECENNGYGSMSCKIQK